jgi:antitoxin YefM
MTTIPVAGARADLSRIVERAEATHERFEITRNGMRAAVLLGADDYDALLETVSVLSDSELIRELGESLKELDAGQSHSVDEVLAAMKAAGRR